MERICRETCDEMVAEQELLEAQLSETQGFRSGDVRTVFAGSTRLLVKPCGVLVDAIFKDAELEARASPSTMFRDWE